MKRTFEFNDDTFKQFTEVINPMKAAKQYKLDKCIQYPFVDMADEDEGQETRIVKGDLHVASIDSTQSQDWNLYNLIVDGNLTVDGDIRWGESGNGSFIFVTGNLKARNMIIQGNAELYVKGNAEIANGILCYEGDDGGYITVKGETKARFVMCTTYFNTSFENQPEAIILGDEDCFDFDIEYTEDNFDDILKAEYLDEDGLINESKVSKALVQGKEILTLDSHVILTPVQQAAKAKKILDKLNDWLEDRDIEECIDISDPVSKKEITKAEKELGVKLPPSYVEFVTKYGTFEFDGDLLGMGSGNYTSLFSPKELVEKTNEYRDEFEKQELFDEEKQITRDGLLYLASPVDEYFEVFVISSADTDGEMKVRSFDYQDLGMNDGWHEGDKTFYSTIADMVKLIKETNK